MFKLILSVLLLIATVYGSGEFIVVHHPHSLTFKGHDYVKESILPEIYSASLGHTTKKYSNWQGLYIDNPFGLPEALVTIVVDGVKEIGYSKGHHFPLKTDTDEFDIYVEMERRFGEHYPQLKTDLIRVDLNDGLENVQQYSMFDRLKVAKPSKGVYLKPSIDEDRAFLEEINLFNAIIDTINNNGLKRDNIPDILWFKFTSLHAINDLYGENSTQVKEAKQLLNEAIVRLNDEFKRIYDDNVLINILVSDNSHTRRSRSILQSTVAAEDNDLNLAKHYSPDYPVIFNIILWFGVAMVFALLAICIAIGTMDPGRDSIIYRMTSTRMKKDN